MKISNWIPFVPVGKSQQEKIKKEGEKQFIEKMLNWHKQYDAKQSELIKAFDIHSVTQWDINIWDEVENNSTHAYVEMNDIPDSVQVNILMHILNHFDKVVYGRIGNLRLELDFYDSSLSYLDLVHEHSYMLFKRWRIVISNIDNERSEEELELLAQLFSKVPHYLDKPFSVTCES